MSSPLTKLAIAFKETDYRPFSEDSLLWFRRKIKSYTHNTRNANSILKEDREVKSVNVGDIVFFGYDAKTKMKLPYWDAFPLICVVQPPKRDRSKERTSPYGFVGVNFHHLLPIQRASLLYMLLSGSDNIEDQNTYRIARGIVDRMFEDVMFMKCFRRYLVKQRITKFMLVQPEEYLSAVFLPTAQYKIQDRRVSMTTAFSKVK